MNCSGRLCICAAAVLATLRREAQASSQDKDLQRWKKIIQDANIQGT